MTELDEWPPRKARTSEDWDAYWERQRWDRRLMRTVIRPRLWRLKRRLTAPLGWPRELRWILHRARHGWAARDTWSLDGYLCEVIGQSVAHLRKTTHSWPGEQNGVATPEDWDSILDKISGPLLAYKTHWDWPDGMDVNEHWENEKKIMAEAQDALRLMADWLPSLWD